MKNKLLCFVTFALFYVVPINNFAQAPNLGSSAKYILFTSGGAITNTGFSLLTGNVGSNNGATTGFGNVNGVMHSSDGSTAACASDLLNLYNEINATIPTSFHAPLLGNGDTMHAGIYAIAGNTSLNLSLILDAQGDPNAVFIFKIQGTFSSSVAAEIILLNNAKACNIFWTVEGLVSLGTSTKMKGNLIANNAAINLNTNVSLEGRAFSTAGAISTNSISAHTPIGCGSPYLTGPAAPALGSTACYSLFSGNGAINNAGASYVAGDIGTNVGLTIGFNPLLVCGLIHPISDVSTAATAADLLNLYSYLNTLPHDIELLYPAQFGNNLTLTPHTYLLNSATTLTDTVFLDAQGNANAIFVIKVNGAFSTSTYAQVVLLNGAQANNVFWKIEGAVDLNYFTNFKGNIISNNGAVNINTGATVEGRVLTTNGAINSAAILISTIPCGDILPVKWLNLTLFLEGYYVTASTMKSVLLNEGMSTNATYVDTMEVQLREEFAPYSLLASEKIILTTNGVATFCFTIAPGNYYIVVKHRNTIETWSAAPIYIGQTLNAYNFSSANSKAYGMNMTEMDPAVWAMYTGDVNQDQNIDLLDIALVENDIAVFASGYLASDVNGDGNVDLLDAPIVETNTSTFIFSSHP